MTAEQELGATYLKSKKIFTKDDAVYGIVSAIYLNKVYPKRYTDKEYFYIYYYIKQPKEELNLYLNGTPPVTKEELHRKNNFTRFTSIKNEWSNYFLVSFEKDDSNETLSLTFENSLSSEALLKYQKDE